MISRKKLWVSICSLAIVVVVGVASIFTILASLSASVNNSFRITYVANNISSGIIGGWNLGDSITDEDPDQYTGSEAKDITCGGGNYLEFTSDQSSLAGTFDDFSIETVVGHASILGYKVLSPEIFFGIVNLGDSAFPIKIDYTEEKENFKTNIFAIGDLTDSNNKKDLTSSGSIEIEVPPSGYTLLDDWFFALDCYALQLLEYDYFFGIFPVFSVPTYANYSKFLEFNEKINELQLFADSDDKLTSDNWVSLFYSSLFPELEGKESNETTFLELREYAKEYISANELSIMIMRLYSLYLALTEEEISVELPKCALIGAIYDIESDIRDASVQANFNFTLGLF